MQTNITNIPKQALTLKEFIQSHSMSRAMFYKLVKNGLAPEIMRVGSRVLITTESAMQWRKKMEKLSKEVNHV